MQKALAEQLSPDAAPVARVLLECDACRSRAYLYQRDADAREARQVIARYCDKCGATTMWRKNQRREIRLRLNMPVCVRVPGISEEVLETENVSRGGLCFKSHQRYIEGAKIEVAVPYTPDGINIFSHYRIRAVEKSAGNGVTQYHLAYIK
jgi:ribosomal protein L33